MRIITSNRTPNPRRVWIFLAEKGVAIPFENLDMMAGGLQSDAVLELNPWRRVPILVLDDGRTISESIAICRYVEALHPMPALFGITAFEQATIEMWNRRVELGLFANVTHAFRHLHPKMAPLETPQITDWGEANKAKAETELARLDERLGESAFLAGDAFSVADITLLVAIDFMKPARLTVSEAFANVWRWHGDVSRRPSASAQ